MLASDRRPDVVDLLVDERATHFWDGERRVGRHYGDDGVAWDVFYLYGPDARWGEPPDATGAPVVSHGESLREALARYST